MQAFKDKARTYQHYYQNKMLKIMHYIGLPLIVFSLLIFLSYFQFSMTNVFSLSIAWIVIACVLAYYIALEWRLGGVLIPVMVLLTVLAHFLTLFGPNKTNLLVLFSCFIVGVVSYLLGFLLSGQRVGFKACCKIALVAPMFLMADALYRFSWFDYLSFLHQPSKEEN